MSSIITPIKYLFLIFFLFSIFNQEIKANTVTPLIVPGNTFSICENASNFKPSINTTFHRADQPAVTFNIYGNEYLMVYIFYTHDGNASVLAQRLDLTGSSFGTPIVISPYQASAPMFRNDKRNPIVVHNTIRNEYMVIWEVDSSQNGTKDEWNILAVRLNHLGVPINPSAIVLQGLANPNHPPSIAYNHKDDIYVIVYERNAKQNNTGLIIQKIDGSGKTDIPSQLSYSSGNDLKQPAIAYHPPTNIFFLTAEYLGTTTNITFMLYYKLTGKGDLMSPKTTFIGGPTALATRKNPQLTNSMPSLTYSTLHQTMLFVWEINAIWTSPYAAEKHVALYLFNITSGKVLKRTTLGTPFGFDAHPTVQYSSQNNTFMVVREHASSITESPMITATLFEGETLNNREIGVVSGSGSDGTHVHTPALGHANASDTFLVLWVHGDPITHITSRSNRNNNVNTHNTYPNNEQYLPRLPQEVHMVVEEERLVSEYLSCGSDAVIWEVKHFQTPITVSKGDVAFKRNSHIQRIINSNVDSVRDSGSNDIPPATIQKSVVCGPVNIGWNVSSTTTWTTTGTPDMSSSSTSSSTTGSVSPTNNSTGGVNNHWENIADAFIRTFEIGGAIGMVLVCCVICCLPICLVLGVKYVFPKLQEQHYKKQKFRKLNSGKDGQEMCGVLDDFTNDPL